jgi:hypothetical protein
MTLSQLEQRVATIEQKLARLVGEASSSAPAELNSWIDQIHGTFQNDAAYKQAAKFGREWRESHRIRRSIRDVGSNTSGSQT